jgi:hypothetical protein
VYGLRETFDGGRGKVKPWQWQGRLFKWHFVLAPVGTTIIVIDREIDRIDQEKVGKLFGGDYHLRRNPGKRVKKEGV